MVGILRQYEIDAARIETELNAAVKRSVRHIPARQLPDKAISVLDTARARVAVARTSKPEAIEALEREDQMPARDAERLEREAGAALDAVVRRATHSDAGARMIDTLLSEFVMPEVAMRILDQVAAGRPVGAIRVDCDSDGRFTVTVAPATGAAEPALARAAAEREEAARGKNERAFLTGPTAPVDLDSVRTRQGDLAQHRGRGTALVALLLSGDHDLVGRRHRFRPDRRQAGDGDPDAGRRHHQTLHQRHRRPHRADAHRRPRFHRALRGGTASLAVDADPFRRLPHLPGKDRAGNRRGGDRLRRHHQEGAERYLSHPRILRSVPRDRLQLHRQAAGRGRHLLFLRACRRQTQAGSGRRR
ncbi:hypothetical protein AZL_a01760 (plasmid) [Azospirillum sp. B510]|nr:hypothetical protein AZL_a01760 [Azospirillum sp. B510]